MCHTAVFVVFLSLKPLPGFTGLTSLEGKSGEKLRVKASLSHVGHWGGTGAFERVMSGL
jgi:hypothetical protein